MLLTWLFGRWRTKSPPRAKRPPRRFRPRVECLEDRVTPSAYTVDRLGDGANDGAGLKGTLRYCVIKAEADAAASNTIGFDSSLSGKAVSLTSALPALNAKITLIQGLGASNLTVQRDPAATTDFSVFNVGSDGVVTIRDLTISQGTGLATAGGGVLNNGELTLENCVVSNNTVSGGGFGGGIYNGNKLILTGTTVQNNKALGTTAYGGGIYNAGQLRTQAFIAPDGTKTPSVIVSNQCDLDGGGIYNVDPNDLFVKVTVTAAVTDTRISDNTAKRNGAGIYNASGDTSALSLNKASLINNRATKNGGALYNDGYAKLLNVTIDANTAAKGGGIYCVVDPKEFMKVNNVTDANNKAVVPVTPNSSVHRSALGPTSDGLGGGLYVEAGAQVQIVNTIIATNTADVASPDVFTEAGGAVTSLGYNLIGDGTGSAGWISSGPGADMVGTSSNPINPLLNPLGDYGGPTPTMTLQAGSPALRAGNVAAVDDVTDQRGLPRTYTDPNGQQYVDIGAVEMQPSDFSAVVRR